MSKVDDTFDFANSLVLGGVRMLSSCVTADPATGEVTNEERINVKIVISNLTFKKRVVCTR